MDEWDAFPDYQEDPWAAFPDAPVNKPQSLGQNIASDFSQRFQNVQGLKHGAADPIVTGLYSTGQAIGFGGDVLGGTIAAITPPQVKEPIMKAVGAAADFASPVTEPIGKAYGQFKQAHPNAAALLETAGNYAGLGLGAKSVQVAGKAINPLAKGLAGEEGGSITLKPKADRLNDKIAKMREQTLNKKQEGGELYNSIDENIRLSPEESGLLLKNMKSFEPKTDLERRDWAASKASRQVDEIVESLSVEPPTVGGMLQKKRTINSLMREAYKSGNDTEAASLRKVRDAIYNSMKGEGGKVSKEADFIWSQQSALDDLDDLMFRALGKNQPANSLDTAIRNYLASRKSAGLSNEEWKALEDVSNNSSFDKLKKGAASGLLKYFAGTAGAHMGPLGAAAGYFAGHYGSEFIKDSAMAAKIQRLDKVREMILSRKMKEVPEDTPKPVLAIGYRGDAARAAESRALAMQRLQEGKTGGLPVEPPQTGPYVGRDGEVPYNYYSPPTEKIPLLPPPDKMSRLPLNEQQINISKRTEERAATKNRRGEGVLKPPASQFEKLSKGLSQKKRGEFSNMAKLLKDGDISQNQFVRDAQAEFGLNSRQARELAREIKVHKTREDLGTQARKKKK